MVGRLPKLGICAFVLDSAPWGHSMEGMKDIKALLPFPIEELRRRLGRKSYARLHEIVSGKVLCPAELAPQIEAATGGMVSRSDMRPDLWPVHGSTPAEPAA